MNSLANRSGRKCLARAGAAVAIIGVFIFTVACGSSHNQAVAPPGGSFGASNLNGTYVFSSTGVDFNGIFLAIAGTFTANGSGGITGGVIDVNGLDFGFSSTAVTTGSYAVTVDGRGHATLNSNTVLGSTVTIDFVLTSISGGISSHGLVTQFDGNGTGSGALDLQNTGTLQSSYGFEFSGASVSGNTEVPFSMAGAFTLDGSGTISAGISDINNNEFSPGGTAGLNLSGSIAAGSPGVATLTTSAGTLNFDVYMVDSTHLKFIETDTFPIMAGDAFTQQASIPSGTLTYIMSGADLGQFPMAMAGFMNSNSGAITAGVEEYNDWGTVAAVSPQFSGSYSPVSGGRSLLILDSIYNGANGSLTPVVKFAAYPTSGGVELLEVDGAGITGGAAFPQTAASFASSQGYGLNLTGINIGGFEEDDIAEFTLNGNSFKGLVDINDEGSLAVDQNFNGSFSADASIPGHGSTTTNAFNFNYYVVDGSTVMMLETDNNQVGLGSFELQGSTGAIPQALTRLRVVGTRARAGAKWSTRKSQRK